MNDFMRLFTYMNNDLRVVEQGGEQWFALKDVCDALGLSNARSIAERLDDDEVRKLDLRGREGETWFVNEYGLLDVIIRSDKPEAKAFRRWITHEVLPSIFKTSRYDVREREYQLKLGRFNLQKANFILKAANTRGIDDTVRMTLIGQAIAMLDGDGDGNDGDGDVSNSDTSSDGYPF